MGSDYTQLDRPEVLSFVFHPRPQIGASISPADISEHLIPVSGAQIGARFHDRHPHGANILFFHGNGEIAADYDELGPIYAQFGINLLAADYRGYGHSSGEPTVSAMMQDAHAVLAYARAWLEKQGHDGPLIVMGRSLGSASALELAAAHGQDLDGLIIESGFAHATELLQRLGVDTDRLKLTETDGFGNLEKIQLYNGPTLIIHAQYDHIIPFADGQALHAASPSAKKRLLQIAGANHNDIFMRGLDIYLRAIAEFVDRCR